MSDFDSFNHDLHHGLDDNLWDAGNDSFSHSTDFSIHDNFSIGQHIIGLDDDGNFIYGHENQIPLLPTEFENSIEHNLPDNSLHHGVVDGHNTEHQADNGVDEHHTWRDTLHDVGSVGRDIGGIASGVKGLDYLKKEAEERKRRMKQEGGEEDKHTDRLSSGTGNKMGRF